ncbi:NADH dehydrogenase [Gandjariella thermophila]|uniref:NADH:ubiquinone reductase (non-electrogenic) n=1 Tax=Gandjariella thermophila TaxID=1931992 RepID=A0A4D4J3R1_9PSEU|nr:NADH dehydrogenase [Gandjariella thermophila]
MVIVGGGFAGLSAARAFRNRPVQVTLVDRAGHHLFQPLLYQCATGILSEGQIATPLRYILRHESNVECVLAEVTGFDVAARTVIATRPTGGVLEIPYDDLIVAAGAEQSYFGHDEFAALAPGMKTLADALTIRRRVFGAFEMAETATDPEERRRWLTFVVVGAGPTGVELAGQIREVATRTLRDEFHRASVADTRVLLFEGGESALASFGPKLAGRAARTLRRLGVELFVHSVVTEVDRRGVAVRGPDRTVTRYEAGTVLWTAGVQAPPLAHALARQTGAEQDRAGRIRVAPDCTIPGHPEISVVGDLMALDHLPGVAEVAMQSGRHAGLRIRRQVEGRAAAGTGKPFRYRDLGSAAYLARGRAVVSFGRVRLGGFVAWCLWIAIHIGFLTGFRNRAGALLTWMITIGWAARRERALTAGQVADLRDGRHAAIPEQAARGRNTARSP